MSLATFSIIVAIDNGNGIAKDGEIPWNTKSDTKFFRDTTIGQKRNAVIMGRLTYESIPEEHRPLAGRHCVVVSRTWKQEDHTDIIVCSSFLEALITVGGSIKNYDEVFVAGGEQIYNEAIRDYLYLCNRIYVTRFKTDYECDQHFPWERIKDFDKFMNPQVTRDYTRYFLVPDEEHDEYQYLEALKGVSEIGESKMDRTGTGTTSHFGLKMKFDISSRIPLVTTKKVSFKNVLSELLFFVSGKTQINELFDKGVKIWSENTSKKFLEQRGLDYEEGDMGPGYGFQWRHWNAEYTGAESEYTNKGIDQLSLLIKGIRDDPHSRRHILSCWNPEQLSEMALPPCHILAQFNVSGDKKHLDCQLYQRSGDMFLGVPYNIACYALLTRMIAHVTNLQARNLIIILGDAHIYNNHGDQVKKQLGRTPHPFPRLKFRKPNSIQEIDDFTFDSFILEGYTSWPAITAKMAV